MADLDTQQIGLPGLKAAYAAANSGGDRFRPDQRTFVHVKNGDAAAHTVTIATPGTAFGQPIDDLQVNVPAGEDRMIGPFPPGGFAGADGMADITYTAATSVTVAVLRV